MHTDSVYRSMMYELPQIPLTPIDLINRLAAATGSMRWAVAAGGADYNGNDVVVSFKPHSVYGPRWSAEYYYGQIVRLGGGSLEKALAGAKLEYDRGLRGASVLINLYDGAPESLEEQVRLVLAVGAVPRTRYLPGDKPTYWTGTHEAVVDALGYSNCRSGRELLTFAQSYRGAIADWPASREAWLNRYHDQLRSAQSA